MKQVSKSAKQLAQEHWAWLEQVLVRQQEVQKHLFISAFIHGHKHGKNSK